MPGRHSVVENWADYCGVEMENLRFRLFLLDLDSGLEQKGLELGLGVM